MNSLRRLDFIDRIDPSSLPEILSELPETRLAKQVPLATLKLLDKSSQRKLYSECAMVSGSIVNTYLKCSSERNVDSIYGVDVNMKHHIGFFGGDRGFSMCIRFRKG